MKINIISIANKLPQWIINACDEYLARINHGKYSCKIIEIKSDKYNNKTAAENMALEAKKINSLIPAGSFVIVLDEKCKNYNSITFAQNLEHISLNYPSITFIIGGADGIHPDLKKSAHSQMQLSSLTYPHLLVRMIILEQIYRAITIFENHPYHRE
jgi:23S rRNA (pseudouridine1915-N3)-methyltransferase